MSWRTEPLRVDRVNHPSHYGGADNSYEAIKVIEAWGLGFCLGNTVKYICRAGRKDVSLRGTLQDLEKAQWYLDREITNLKKNLCDMCHSLPPCADSQCWQKTE